MGQTRDTFAIDLTTDGRETAIDRGEVQIRARTFWDGETLAFDAPVAREPARLRRRGRLRLA